MLSFFPRGVLDEILNLIGSVSEGFPSYPCLYAFARVLWSILAGDQKIQHTLLETILSFICSPIHHSYVSIFGSMSVVGTNVVGISLNFITLKKEQEL